MNKNQKMGLTIFAAVLITFGIYYGMQYSLTQPTINRIPITEETAKLVVIRTQNKSSENMNNFETEYVYIRGNGSVYRSDPQTNNIGVYIGNADITITGGNHFSWKVVDNKTKEVFFVEHVTGEIVSILKNNSKLL